jgi:hypothetical protein
MYKQYAHRRFHEPYRVFGKLNSFGETNGFFAVPIRTVRFVRKSRRILVKLGRAFCLLQYFSILSTGCWSLPLCTGLHIRL